MSTKETQSRFFLRAANRATQIGKGVVVAGAVAALSLTTAPTAAYAGGNGVGAAIGLGVLGGVIAGAAIASSAPPVYGAPPSAYDYPPQPYQGYYAPAPAYYYPAQQPYYGWTPYYR